MTVASAHTSVAVEFTPQSVAAFRAACKEMERTTRRTMPDIVLWASKFFLVSCRAHTPVCKAKARDVRRNPDYDVRDPMTGLPMSRFPVQARVWRQTGAPYEWVGFKPEDTAKATAIRYAGAAWNSWNGAYRRLGKSARTKGGGKGSNWSDAQKRLTKAQPEVELQNMTSYMPKIAPGLLAGSIDRTTRSLEHQMSRQVKRELRKAWGV